MNYISVKEASVKFNISERRIQKLCEDNRIDGCKMISRVWLIPEDAKKPVDDRFSHIPNNGNLLSLSELCKSLSISMATGRNWIKLGKIKPNYTEKGTPFFRADYVEDLKTNILSGSNEALKSRRNKKFISGNTLYNSYVSENSKNLQLVQDLLSIIEVAHIPLTENIIKYLIADCSIKLHLKKTNTLIHDTSRTFTDFLANKIHIKGKELIDDLIDDKDEATSFSLAHKSFFSIDYVYEENEDIPGLIYISCKNIGNRKATGTYYTPTRIVKKLVNSLSFMDDSSILDPCCGSGNFLLQIPDNILFSNIYGNDIDPISVKIARINMSLKYTNIPIKEIKEHITETNFLTNYKKLDFTHIIGNPPWGYSFNESEKIALREKFKSAAMNNIESYDVFIEHSLSLLKINGELSFVLPEAILNVKAHSDIRSIIIDSTNIKEITYLGNVFDGVQCPCIIFRIENTRKKMSSKGMIISNENTHYTINTERNVTPSYFSFFTTDSEYSILQKIKNNSNSTNLLGNAVFALGIVTGNNKDYISTNKTKENEIILKGSDIKKYRICPSENYIIFKPENFQQVAPVQMYRAKEKLLYRFISNQLIFAYDDKKTLSLNSCNILIPKFKDLNIKYIMAILNSRIAQFIFKKEFNSIKVLRSHIENIPIPYISEEKQKQFIELTDKISLETEPARIIQLYDKLDSSICSLFKLSKKEQLEIRLAVDVDNKFLI